MKSKLLRILLALLFIGSVAEVACAQTTVTLGCLDSTGGTGGGNITIIDSDAASASGVITQIKAPVNAVGSGSLTFGVFSGSGGAGSYTLLRSVTITGISATGVTTWNSGTAFTAMPITSGNYFGVIENSSTASLAYGNGATCSNNTFFSVGSYAPMSVGTVVTTGTGGAESFQATITELTSQTITFGSIASHYVGDVFSLSATASSGLAVSFAVTSGPATISGTTLTVTGAGTVVVTATQAGNGTYAAATPVSQSFSTTAGTTPQTITFGAFAGAYHSGDVLPLSAYSSSGLPVSYAIISGPATVSGSTLTVLGVGSITVQATQAGAGAYQAATPVSQSFTALPALVGYSQVTHVNIVNPNGTPLANGSECFTPVNAKGVPIAATFSASGTVGTVQRNPACAKVTNGAIVGTINADGSVTPGFHLVDTTKTNPVNLCYSMILTNTDTNQTIIGPRDGFACVQPSGSTFEISSVYPNTPAMVPAVQGAAGAPGANGQSAYQLAVSQGYSGTLTQWLASLQGTSYQPYAGLRFGVWGHSLTTPGFEYTGVTIGSTTYTYWQQALAALTGMTWVFNNGVPGAGFYNAFNNYGVVQVGGNFTSGSPTATSVFANGGAALTNLTVGMSCTGLPQGSATISSLNLGASTITFSNNSPNTTADYSVFCGTPVGISTVNSTLSEGTPGGGVNGGAMTSGTTLAQDLANVDVLFVWYGDNDYNKYGSGITGSPGDTLSAHSSYGDADNFLATIYAAKPGIRVILLDHAFAGQAFGITGYQAIHTLEYTVGQYWGTGVMDMLTVSGINPSNWATWMNTDSGFYLHPTNTGWAHLVPIIARELNAY